MSAAIAGNSRPAPSAPFRDRLARSRQAALERWVEAAINLLDLLDGDPDQETTALERAGLGFQPCPLDDHEDGHDAEQDDTQRGIADQDGFAEQVQRQGLAA